MHYTHTIHTHTNINTHTMQCMESLVCTIANRTVILEWLIVIRTTVDTLHSTGYSP